MKNYSLLLALVTCIVLTPHLTAQQRRQIRRTGGDTASYRSMSVKQDRFEIPITLASTQILIDGVKVNGKGPFRFMLDTGGMGGGRVDASLVKKLDLKPTGKVMAGDGTGRPGREMPTFELDSLEIAGAKFSGLRVLSRDYNKHGAAVRGHIDGIIGFGLFKNLLLTIDYSQRKLTVARGSLPQPDGKTVLNAKNEGVAGVDVQIAGQSYKAHLDTGAMGWISISEEIAKKLKFVSEPVKIGEARTLTGAFPIKRARLNGIAKLGKHEIKNPYVVIGAPLRGVNFGGFVLRDFVVTYDQKNDRIKVVPAKSVRPSGAPASARLGRQPITVTMDTKTGHPIVHAKINGKGPFPFVLDTGAGTVLLNDDLVKEIGLKSTGKTKIGDPSDPNSVDAKTYQLKNISIGNAQFEQLGAISWKGFPRSKVRGVIGITMLYDAIVTFDYPNHQLHIRRGALGPDAKSFYYDGSGYLTVDLKFGKKSIKTHIDSGNMGYLMLPLSMAKELKLQSKPRIIGRAKSINGTFDIHQATLDGNLNFAGQTFTNPTIHFNDRFNWGNIGSRFMSDYAVTIDQVNQRIQLKKPTPKKPKK